MIEKIKELIIERDLDKSIELEQDLCERPFFESQLLEIVNDVDQLINVRGVAARILFAHVPLQSPFSEKMKPLLKHEKNLIRLGVVLGLIDRKDKESLSLFQEDASTLIQLEISSFLEEE